MSAANRDRKVAQRSRLQHSRLRLMGIDWSKYAARQPSLPRQIQLSVIDEAHVIITGTYTRSVASVYSDVAAMVQGNPSLNFGLPGAGYSLACGSCSRSMLCLRGQPPAIICPQCRRAGHDHNAPFAHLFRGDPEGYRLIDAFGQKVAEWFDYVPSACPLWVTREPHIVDQKPCPICVAKTKVKIIYVVHDRPTKHQRPLIRLGAPPKKSTPPSNPMKTFLERRYVSHKRGGKGRLCARPQQTMQRPPRRTAAR